MFSCSEYYWFCHHCCHLEKKSGPTEPEPVSQGSHGEVGRTAESHGVLLPNDQAGASEAPGAFSAGEGMETN